MAIDYGTVKSVHVSAAALSIALFVLRSAWRAAMPSMLDVAWVRIGPHVVDTVLLVSALWLAWQFPAGMPHAWLAAKIVALDVYIVLGTIALKRRRTPAVRIAAFVGAIATFGYIVTVALTKSPLGFLGWM